jgi:hypothetical protein
VQPWNCSSASGLSAFPGPIRTVRELLAATSICRKAGSFGLGWLGEVGKVHRVRPAYG